MDTPIVFTQVRNRCAMRTGFPITLILSLFLAAYSLNSPAQFAASVQPSSVEAGRRTVLSIELAVTATVPAGAEIVLNVPSGMSNLIWPFFTNIFVSSTGNAAMEITQMVSPEVVQPPIWDNDNLPVLLFARVRNQPLLPGDIVRFTLGNDDFGDTFLVGVPRTAGTVNFRVGIVSTSSVWTEAAVFPIQLRSRDAAYLKAVMPTVLATGEEGILRITAGDEFYNRSRQFHARLKLLGDPAVDMPGIVNMTEADSGYLEVPVSVYSEGFYNVEIKVLEAGNALPSLLNATAIESNYVRVRNDPQHYIYWGDLHSHSGWSRDGQGTGSFDYARKMACLDFFSPAEHVNGNGNDTFGINTSEWQLIKQKILEYHEPGRFIPMTAYETSYYANEGGHNILYFEHGDSTIDEIPLLPRKVYRTVFQVVDALGQLPPYIRPLYIPHFTGQIFYINDDDPDWGLDDLPINQGDIPRLVGQEYISPYRTLFELYSDHGQSEFFDPGHPLNGSTNFWFVQDALAMGEKLGFTAFTDNHTGQPGYPGAGLGAVLAPELTRTGVFHAMRNRHMYATTGERMYMDFRVNDSIMGSEIEIDIDMVPIISYKVFGTAPLERIDVLKWDFIEGTYGDDYHPDFEIIRSWSFDGSTLEAEAEFQDMDFYGHSLYYLRVIQANEVAGKPVWGWSSPVWVNNANLDTTITGLFVAETVAGLQLYPNPVPGDGTLRAVLHLNQPETVVFAIFDASGRYWSGYSRPVDQGETNLRIPLHGLVPGSYHIRLSDRAGHLREYAGFIVR